MERDSLSQEGGRSGTKGSGGQDGKPLWFPDRLEMKEKSHPGLCLWPKQLEAPCPPLLVGEAAAGAEFSWGFVCDRRPGGNAKQAAGRDDTSFQRQLGVGVPALETSRGVKLARLSGCPLLAFLLRIVLFPNSSTFPTP